MRKILPGLVLGALAGAALSVTMAPAFAGEAAAPAAPKAPATAAAPAAAHYSVETTLVGKLLDDPAANELLKKMIPSVYGNEMFHSMGRDSTLKSIQQYEPEALSDANLAKIQAELNKIPAKG
jgi:para-nitrobenzyl esterase